MFATRRPGASRRISPVVASGPQNAAPSVAITSPAGGTVVVEGTATTVSGTCADTDGTVSSVTVYFGATLLGSATVGAGTWSYSWTPTASQAGGTSDATGQVASATANLTAVATDNLGVTTTSSAVSVTCKTVAKNSIDLLNTVGFSIGHWGHQAVKDASNGEAGDQATQYTDLTGNGRHATQLTSADDQPTLAIFNSRPVLSFDNDDGTSGDSMTLPHAWLSGANKVCFFLAFHALEPTSTQRIFAYTANAWAIVLGSVVKLQITGVSFASFAFTDAASMHLLYVEFDGTQATNATRMKMELDGVSKTLAFNGTIPAAIGTLTSGMLGRNTDNTVPYDGDVAAYWGVAGKILTADEKTLAYTHLNTLLGITVA